MSESETERGSLAVFLASCTKQSMTIYYSLPQQYFLFSTPRFYIKIDEGRGVLYQQTVEIDTIDNDTDFDDIFDVNNGMFENSSNDSYEKTGIMIFRHIKHQVEMLYCAEVLDLRLGFGVIGPKVYITEVFSCKTAVHQLSKYLKSVPDAIDIIAQVIVTATSSKLPTDQCFFHRDECTKSLTRVTFGSILHYYISDIFYDCDIESVTKFIKNMINLIDDKAINKTITICNKCFITQQVFECQKQKRSKSKSYLSNTTHSSNMKSLITSSKPPIKLNQTSNMIMRKSQDSKPVPHVVQRLLDPMPPRITITGTFATGNLNTQFTSTTSNDRLRSSLRPSLRLNNRK